MPDVTESVAVNEVGDSRQKPADKKTSPVIAVCFYGITRSLRYTMPSITEQVLEPLRRLGPVRIYAHFFRQETIDNPRSGEKGPLDSSEYRLLGADRLLLEDPNVCLDLAGFDEIAAFGDYWRDGYRSLRNLIHQLHSLETVTGLALSEGAEICLFCRPDLRYHDSLKSAGQRALTTPGSLVQLPWWQPSTAMNDRFAIASGAAAIEAYGSRRSLALDYCRSGNRPLHAEGLVKYVLGRAGIPVRTIPVRASRVRFDGTEVQEDFRHPRAIRLRDRFGVDADPLLRWLLR